MYEILSLSFEARLYFKICGLLNEITETTYNMYTTELIANECVCYYNDMRKGQMIVNKVGYRTN